MVAKLGNIRFERNICVREAKMFLTLSKIFFFFRAAEFVSAAYVSRATQTPDFSAVRDIWRITLTECQLRAKN